MVRSSGLVHAFIGLFEALWTLGMPVSSGAKQELLSDRDRAIITLMADVRAAERGLLWVRPLPRRAAPQSLSFDRLKRRRLSLLFNLLASSRF